MADKEDLRQQFTDAFEGADYPVNSPMDLVPALPNGPATTFESGDFSMTAMELNTQAGGSQEFPYDNVDDLVDDIMDGLEEEGYI
ncbi:MTH865 family protein [Halorarius halobius]|uniref:MTH865 family protein n=1 Tax=Halorarius halobius TaxID=2962671 RepID=UPI0020CC151C|nr:MTH865 family protein [Halorarius halobius]